MKLFRLGVLTLQRETGVITLVLNGETHVISYEYPLTSSESNTYGTDTPTEIQKLGSILSSIGFDIVTIHDFTVIAEIIAEELTVEPSLTALISVESNMDFRIISVKDEPAPTDRQNTYTLSILTSQNMRHVLSPFMTTEIVDGVSVSQVIRRDAGAELIIAESMGLIETSEDYFAPGLGMESEDIVLRQVGEVLFVDVDPKFMPTKYKLNDGAWSVYPSFINWNAGENIIHVEDSLGWSNSNTIETVGTDEVIQQNLVIPIENTFMFKKDNDLLGNDENLTECDSMSDLCYKQQTYIDDTDIVTTQIKSATIPTVKFNGVDVLVLKKTDNLNRKEFTDVMIEGDMICFTAPVNKYEDDGTTIIDTVNHNGLLPEWVAPNRYISLVYADGSITPARITYTGKYNGLTVFNYFKVESAAALPLVVKVQVNYQLAPYDVWECVTLGADVIAESFMTVSIQSKELGYIEEKSEPIVNINDFPYVTFMKIKYKNDINTEMFYATGIVNVINMPFVSSVLVDKNEAISYIGDDNIYNVDRTNDIINKYSFDVVTKPQVRKLGIALTRTTVIMNDVVSVLKSFSSTNLVGTNGYTSTAEMYYVADVNDYAQSLKMFDAGVSSETEQLPTSDLSREEALELFVARSGGSASRMFGELFGIGGRFVDGVYTVLVNPNGIECIKVGGGNIVLNIKEAAETEGTHEQKFQAKSGIVANMSDIKPTERKINGFWFDTSSNTDKEAIEVNNKFNGWIGDERYVVGIVKALPFDINDTSKVSLISDNRL